MFKIGFEKTRRALDRRRQKIMRERDRKRGGWESGGG